MYPLKWAHVYVPVVPSSLLGLIEAPVPFILGTHKNWLPLIPTDCLCDVVVIDCDAGLVIRNSVQIPSWPADIRRWLMMGINMIMYTHFGTDDLDRGAASSHQEHQYSATADAAAALEEWREQMGDVFAHAPLMGLSIRGAMLQLLVFDTLSNLLKSVPRCLFFLSPSSPVFNRQLFLEEFAIDNYRDFLEALTDTNAFNQLVEAIYCPELAFFIDCVKVLNRSTLQSTAHRAATEPSLKNWSESERSFFSQKLGTESFHCIQVALMTSLSMRSRWVVRPCSCFPIGFRI